MKSWGWKTLLGIGVMVVTFGLDLAGTTPGHTIDRLFGLGQIIAFFGLRDAIRKS